MAQVNARQLAAPTEHIPQIVHKVGVQVLHARDGFKICHTTEPTEGGRRVGTGERGVKDHLGHIGSGAVCVPTGIVAAARVQVVGPARAAAALAVVVERQRRVRRRVAGIGFFKSAEVARVARAAVEVGIGLVHMAGIVSRALVARQLGAIIEHIGG